MFADDLNYLVGTATYRYSVLDVAWEAVEGSFNALDSVLDFDKQLSEQYEQAYEKIG